MVSNIIVLSYNISLEKVLSSDLYFKVLEGNKHSIYIHMMPYNQLFKAVKYSSCVHLYYL